MPLYLRGCTLPPVAVVNYTLDTVLPPYTLVVLVPPHLYNLLHLIAHCIALGRPLVQDSILYLLLWDADRAS